jgi:hypothetical protein
MALELGTEVGDGERVKRRIMGVFAATSQSVSFRAFTVGELNAVIRQNGVDFGRQPALVPGRGH